MLELNTNLNSVRNAVEFKEVRLPVTRVDLSQRIEDLLYQGGFTPRTTIWQRVNYPPPNKGRLVLDIQPTIINFGVHINRYRAREKMLKNGIIPADPRTGLICATRFDEKFRDKWVVCLDEEDDSYRVRGLLIIDYVAFIKYANCSFFKGRWDFSYWFLGYRPV